MYTYTSPASLEDISLLGQFAGVPQDGGQASLGLWGGIMIDTAASRLERSVTLVIEAFARAQSGRGL